MGSCCGKCSLGELDLKFVYDIDNHYLSCSIVLAKSINVMSLRGFSLMSLSSMDIKFSSLKKLDLSHVYLEDPIMIKLISGCPLLEMFKLMECKGLETICVIGLRRLKVLGLRGVSGVKMVKIEDAPELLNLNMIGLSEFCKVNMANLVSLRKLHLHGLFISENYLHQLVVPQCPSLECLTIGGSKTLENMKISSDKIKALRVYGLDKLVKAEINAPNLESFCFRTDLFALLPTFLLNAPNVLEVSLRLIVGCVNDLSYDQLIKCLGYFDHVRIVNILGCSNDVIIPMYKRVVYLSPLKQTRDLNLYILFDMKYSILEVLEYMLWLSPQVESLLISNGKKCNIVLKFHHEKNARGDSSRPCCESFSSHCWQCSLAEVRVDQFEGEEVGDVANMKNFFFHQLGENLKIVENSKIVREVI